jgi:predicted lipoprotein with Yx(FWY)xxD motif
MFTRTSRLLLLAAVPALLAVACGSTKPTAVGTQPPATAATATTGAAAGGVAVATKSTAIGSVLVDSTGMTLYHLDKDVNGTPTCTAGCATIWPPVIVPASGAPSAGSGVTGTLGQTARPDGSQQLTWNGMPLYHYSKDTAPGDTHGDGIGGVWHAAMLSASGAGGATTTTAAGYHY